MGLSEFTWHGPLEAVRPPSYDSETPVVPDDRNSLLSGFELTGLNTKTRTITRIASIAPARNPAINLTADETLFPLSCLMIEYPFGFTAIVH